MQLKCMDLRFRPMYGPHLVHQRLSRRSGSGASGVAQDRVWDLCVSEGMTSLRESTWDRAMTPAWNTDWEKHSGGKQTADVQDLFMQEPCPCWWPAGVFSSKLSLFWRDNMMLMRNRFMWAGFWQHKHKVWSASYFSPRITWTEESLWLRCNVTKHSWLFTSHL